MSTSEPRFPGGAPRATGLGAALALVGAHLICTPIPLGAQEPEVDRATGAGVMGRIVAHVSDAESGAPVDAAFLQMTTLDRRAISDTAGTAVFQDLPPGAHEILIRRIGYEERTVGVRLGSMSTAVVDVTLVPTAVAVAPLEVEIEHRPRYLEDRGFYVRREAGIGKFFDPQFVERWNVGIWSRADRFLDLIRDLSPPFCGAPTVYLDGHRLFRPTSWLEVMSTYEIGAVEVYDGYGSAGMPLWALDPMGCGAILVWTNRWRHLQLVELGGGEVELCEPAERTHTSVEGLIRDEFTGVLLPGAHVVATTYPDGRPRTAVETETVADADGRYRVCDVPPGHTLSLKVTVAERIGTEFQIPLEGPIVTRDLEVRLAGPGDVVGRVVDRSTGRPVAAADVRVPGLEAHAQTDRLGYFRIDELRPGDHVIEIAHLGFEPVEEVVSVVADRTVDLRVEMTADPIALAPLVVTALRDRRLELRGFYDRRITGERLGQGHFFERDDLERRTLSRITSLLQQLPGIDVRCSGARNCRVMPARQGSCARMNVYINGSLALGESRADPLGLDELVLPAEIAAMEVYSGAASVPAEFTGMSGRCGAIVIWTG